MADLAGFDKLMTSLLEVRLKEGASDSRVSLSFSGMLSYGAFWNSEMSSCYGGGIHGQDHPSIIKDHILTD